MAAVETRSAELKIRIRPSLKAAIAKAADRNGRTVSAWVERLLEEAVKAQPTQRKK
jgi:hypothetical protein